MSNGPEPEFFMGQYLEFEAAWVAFKSTGLAMTSEMVLKERIDAAEMWVISGRKLPKGITFEAPLPPGVNVPIADALRDQVGGNHYKDCKIQPVEFIEANGIQFLEGCIIKRAARHGHITGKGKQDIEKIIHEAQLLLKLRYPND
jgi:hypothetical protein